MADTPKIDTYKITFGGRPLVDPAAAMRTCQDHKFPDSHFRGRAFCYLCPVGSTPGGGVLLMRKADLDAVRQQKTADLVVSYTTAGGGAVRQKIPGMIVVSDMLAFPASATEDDTVYVVEYADDRHAKRMRPANAAFNVRLPAGGGEYLAATTSGGALYTWPQVVSALWTAAGLGTAPALPYTPGGTPDGLSYFGHGPALDALADVLTRINLVLVFDPRDTTYKITRPAADRGTLTAFDDGQRYTAWDDIPRQWPQADWPEKIRVVFRRVPVPIDGGDPNYSTDVTPTPAPSNFQPGTTLVLYDDLTALPGGVPSNNAALLSRAAERAAEWVRRRASVEFPTGRLYKGFVPAAFDLLGQQVAAVGFHDRGGRSDGGSFCTELHSEPAGALAAWQPARYAGSGAALGTRAFVTDAYADAVGRLRVTYNLGYAPTAAAVTGPWGAAGRVSQAGAGVPGVGVYASSGQQVVTDSNGDYSFVNLPAGTVTLLPAVPPSQTSSPASITLALGPTATGQNFTFS